MNRCEYKFRQSYECGLALVVLAGIVLFAAGVNLGASSIHAMGMQATGAQTAGGQATGAARASQTAKHGGIFLVSTDKHHAIEAVLLSRFHFSLYVYDYKGSAPPEQLTGDKLKQVAATVQWTDGPDAPKTPLEVTADQLVGQVGWVPHSDSDVADARFPLTLIVHIVFPGAPPNAKSEVFKLTFSRDTDEEPISQPPVSSGDHSGRTNAPAPPAEHSMDTLEHRPGR